MRLAWQDRVLGVLLSGGFISQNHAAKLKKRYPKGFMLNGKIRDDNWAELMFLPNILLLYNLTYVVSSPSTECSTLI